MHELSLTERIMTIVKSELDRRQVQVPVEKITVNAGKLSAIIPDSLQFYFDLIKKETPGFENATLEIKELPIVVFCAQCNARHEMERPDFTCPKCGGTVTVESGADLTVESIVVQD